MATTDYLFRGDLAQLDPDVADLIRHETARQARRLIMIPSESTIPQAVREAVGSAFHNIYAEGYPLDDMRWMSEAEILDYNARLANYRRNGDNRYYKGTEYANLIESLARRRVAEAFANERVSADDLYVNVQPLSGAPANSAAYTAMLEVGDTVMGLDLLDGGHLTHGSPVNRSGIYYNIVSYGVDPVTEQLDYDEILRLAQEHQPKMIIAGFTSYPLAPDFQKFRDIADAVGAYLLADIAHTAGMAITGDYPNPVGIADVVNFTTHKTLGGPRGAVSITHHKHLYKKIDRAVFPGEQGGPHMNSVAGLAVAMQLAKTDQFQKLQHQTAENAITLAKTLESRGIRIPYGGTDTHMLLIDCKSITAADGTPLSGDMAARILDLCGIVANRNTIPGDKSAFRASGVRLGTAWITQRGFHQEETEKLGHIIADVLHACTPFTYPGKRRPQLRAKIDFDTFEQAKLRVRGLVDHIGIDTDAAADGYPHFYYMETETTGWQTLGVYGEHAAPFLDKAITGTLDNQQTATWILEADGTPMSRGVVEPTEDGYCLHVEENTQRVLAWLRALSDGFVLFDPADPQAKLPGPVDVQHIGPTPEGALQVESWEDAYADKPYFIGMNGENFARQETDPLPTFEWTNPEQDTLLTTPLHGLHTEMGAKMVEFAGYDMPVWYSSVSEEHKAVRTQAGVFDVSHMGVFDVQGPGAAAFMDTVFTNDINKLSVGRTMYGFLLDVDGLPLDDLIVYRLGNEHFMLVVNAANNDKNWAWLNAVKNGKVQIDAQNPGKRIDGDTFTLRDLRDAESGGDQRLDIALQGPRSNEILAALGGDMSTIRALKWADVTQTQLGDYDLIVSRTGYTGERTAYELFVHPDQVVSLFKDLVEAGAVPCGLAARDSLRTEAGLPLYGHELAGPLNLDPVAAGMTGFVRFWKPFFIGKRALVEHMPQQDGEVIRFRLNQKGARPPHQGDAVVDQRGRVVGIVTSCAADSDGYQLGQAFVQQPAATEGTSIGVLKANGGGTHHTYQLGDRVTIPQNATVLSRFPKRK